MKKLFFYFCFVFCFGSSAFSQTVIINEVSQGASGVQEYVELLVVWTPGCISAVPCLDMRKFYLDDNNGFFGSGGGTGIASGCVRLTNTPFWSCIPAGTKILIYNDADLNPSVPSMDTLMSDGNCTLVIPISTCSLFETNSTTPNTGSSTFPTTGFTPCGNWTSLGMANGSDSFQVRDSNAVLIHAVSWGNNNLNNMLYLGNIAMNSSVASMLNTVDNNQNNLANWSVAFAPAFETPGAANDATNGTWIGSMNNNCAPLTPMSATSVNVNPSCVCDGTIAITVAGSPPGPYFFAWTPNVSVTSSASSLCPGTYSVTVTNGTGCTTNFVTTLVQNSSIAIHNVINTPITCFGGNNGSVTSQGGGGTPPYTYLWSNGQPSATATGMTSAVYTVTVTDALGCVSTDTVHILQPPRITYANTVTDPKCFGGNDGSVSVIASNGIAPYAFLWSNSQTSSTATGLSTGIYYLHITDANNCSVNDTVAVLQPTQIALAFTSQGDKCQRGEGESAVTPSGGTPPYSYLWSDGKTIYNATGLKSGTYTVTTTDSHGCAVSGSVSIGNSGTIPVAACDTTLDLLSSTVSFEDKTPGSVKWLWDFGGGISTSSSKTSHYYENPGKYSVLLIATNSDGCSDSLVINIEIPVSIDLPNVLTPNGDGLNDVLYFSLPGTSDINLSIFNRWGGLVYQNNTDASHWDGKLKTGKEVPDGVYFFILNFKTFSETISKKGFITLER